MYAKYCVMLHRSRAKDDEIFYMGHDGGCMIRCGAKLVRTEKGNPQKPTVRTVLSSRETSVAEGALVSPAETLNKDVAPIGDDTEPSGAPREKVE